MPRLAAAVFAALIPVAATAQDYISVNRMIVHPMSATSFEVVERQDTGVRSAWCAASDYVRNRLGDPVRARIYLMTPQGPSRTYPGARSVTFTIAPDAALKAAGPSYSASLTKVGTNLSVVAANTYCRDLIEEMIERD